MNYSNLGKTIRELRNKRELTQRQLAEKMGVTVTCISMIETRQRSISEETLQKAADALGVPSLFIQCWATTEHDVKGKGSVGSEILKSIKDLIGCYMELPA